jgi:hypothetical protein
MIGYAIRSSWACGMIRKRPKLSGRKQMFFVVLLPDGTVVEPRVARRL